MFIVHENFKDVFFEVIKTQYQGPKYRKIRGRWWNLGFTGNPWLADIRPQTIKIFEKDWARWKQFNPGQPETHPGRR